MGNAFWSKVLAVAAAGALLLNLLTAFIAEAITAWVCGTRPSPTGPFSGLVTGVTGDQAAYNAPPGCALPVWPIRALDVVALIVLAGLTIWAMVAWRRYRHSDARFIADLRRRPGFATGSEIRRYLSAAAVLRHASCDPPSRTQGRVMSDGESADPEEQMCSCRSKTRSRSKVRPGPGRGTGS